jgi:glutamine synthetase
MDLRERIKQSNARSLRLVFCNASGIPCSKAWVASHLEDMLANGIEIFKGNYFMCLGVSPSPGSSFKINAGDVKLMPDINTFSILPYVPETGRFYGDFYDKDTGQPWDCCARNLLKKTLLSLRQEEGLLCETAGELEFYLTKLDSSNENVFLKLHSAGKVPPFSTRGLDIASVFINEAIRNLSSVGLDITRIVREGGSGQYELNLSHSEGLKAADDILTLREVVKGTALQQGLNATFMPKPFADELGNGMHIHQTLRDYKTGRNVFFDSSDKKGNMVSSLGYMYAAGILYHGAALCAVAASTVNSYKRLRPGWVAVDEMRYGKDDRGAAVRIPRPSNFSDSVRIEYRVPDAACNPYLLLSCMIAAGVDGIRRNLDVEEFLGSEKSAQTKLPKSLGEALKYFKEDQLFRSLLGQTFFEEYIKLKEFEMEIFNQNVSNFEVEKYGFAF